MIPTVFLYLSRKQTATVCHFPELIYFQEDVLAQGPSTKLKLEYLSCFIEIPKNRFALAKKEENTDTRYVVRFVFSILIIIMVIKLN